MGCDKKTELATSFIEFCQQSDEVRAKLDLQFVFSTSSETRELGAMKRLFAALRGGTSTGPVADTWALNEARQWWNDVRKSDAVAANCFAHTMLDHGHKLLTAEALGKAANAAKAAASPAAAATAQTIVDSSAARQVAAIHFFKKIKEVLVNGGAEKDAVTSTLQRLMDSYNMVTALTGGVGCQLVARGLLELTQFDVTLRETIDAHSPADFPSLVEGGSERGFLPYRYESCDHDRYEIRIVPSRSIRDTDKGGAELELAPHIQAGPTRQSLCR